MSKPKYLSLREWCDQCEALSINGQLCHETGCPNAKKIKVDGIWTKVFKCFYCGDSVLDGETCDCQDFSR